MLVLIVCIFRAHYISKNLVSFSLYCHFVFRAPLACPYEPPYKFDFHLGIGHLTRYLHNPRTGRSLRRPEDPGLAPHILYVDFLAPGFSMLASVECRVVPTENKTLIDDCLTPGKLNIWDFTAVYS
jgi:hypothetical protein